MSAKREQAKILIFDTEIAPILAYVWKRYEANVVHVLKEQEMLCYAYKWLGGKTQVVTLRDFTGKREYKLVKSLRDLIEQADIIIAHNGDSFDLKITNTRIIYHGLPPIPEIKTVDTLKLARRHFKFSSNKLGDLGEFLGLGGKVKHEGFDLWLGCMNDNEKSWKTMIRYNKQDVDLLEKVYLKIRPFVKNHPNLNIYQKTTYSCPKCGSDKIVKWGFHYLKKKVQQRYRCKNCTALTPGENIIVNKDIIG